MNSDRCEERPIIFNTDMVRAILDGRKTQTRRPIKPQPCIDQDNIVEWKDIQCHIKAFQKWDCPYGKVGDRLWVRETFAIHCARAIYKQEGKWNDIVDGDLIKWLSPACMHKNYSRRTLEITDIRVERVQEISEEDAKKEGLVTTSYDVVHGVTQRSAFGNFIELWNSIYKNWDDNPYVWVLTFKKV